MTEGLPVEASHTDPNQVRSPEELVAEISDAARTLMEAHGGEPVAQPDGSTLRELRGNPLTGMVVDVFVSEHKPADAGPAEYVYGATRQTNPNNMQLFRWTEGGAMLEKRVRSNVWRDAEDQMHGTVAPSETLVSWPAFQMRSLGRALEHKPSATPEEQKGRLGALLGRLSFRRGRGIQTKP